MAKQKTISSWEKNTPESKLIQHFMHAKQNLNMSIFKYALRVSFLERVDEIFCF